MVVCMPVCSVNTSSLKKATVSLSFKATLIDVLEKF